MKLAKKVLLLMTACLLVVSLFSFAMSSPSVAAEKSLKASDSKKSKNLIVLIGDGMGPGQVTLSRLYAQKYEKMDQLYMDNYLVGTNSTFADVSYDGKSSGIITDSAASGTAFATGNKTYNGAISVTNEQVAKPVASVIEAAQAEGKGTGIISTARLTHATPAVYASHVRSRGNENAIAAQFVESDVDVLIGGGEYHFVADKKDAEFGRAKREDGRNLVEEFKEKGYTVASDKESLRNAEGDKLLALLSDSHVPYELDREESVPRLNEQLTKAIEVLEKNDEGFVLMVEAGRIDHAGHANDIHSVVRELLEFDEAFATAVEYAKKSGDTTVIATADHETGGLTLGRDNISDIYYDSFGNVKASSEKIGSKLEKATSDAEIKAIMKEYAAIEDLTANELAQLKKANGEKASPSGSDVFNIVIAKRSNIGWTGYGHTAVDVGVYGYGPAAELLRGFNDNTDFAKAGATALGLNLEKATKNLQEKYAYPIVKKSEVGETLFPAEDLQDLLGIKVEKNNGSVTVSGDRFSFTMKQNAEQVQVANRMFEANAQGEDVYIPFELLQLLSNKKITWDGLSERIVME